MKKRIAIILGSILLLILLFIFTDYLKKTTFGESLTGAGIDQDNVLEIYIEDASDLSNRRSVIIRDKDLIKNLLDYSMDMKLKRTNELPEKVTFFVNFLLSSGSEIYTHIGANDFQIGSHYSIKGENKFITFIENQELNWESH